MRESMEEKIQNVIKWVSKYPLKKALSDEMEEEYEKSYKDEGWTEEWYVDQQDKIISDYNYLRTMRSKGKLTEEQIEKLKNANVGGVFGYSTEVERLDNDYNIPTDEGVKIIRKYGSIENFFNQYRNGILNKEENLIVSKLFKPIYDIDLNEKSDKYDKLVRCIFSSDGKGLYFYSSKKLEEVLSTTLSEQDLELLKARFGLDGSGIKTLEEVGNMFHITRAQAMHHEEKYLRVLKNDINLFLGDLNNYINVYNSLDNKLISEEEIIKADDTLRLSRDLNEKTIRAQELIKDVVMNALNYNQKNIEELQQEKVSIEETEPSVRLYNCLTNSGINTLGDILSKNIKEIIKIPGMSKDSIVELAYIMKNYGYEINGEKFVPKNKLNIAISQDPQGQDPQGNTPIGGHRHP